MKVKNDHRSKFSNLSNWKEEAGKKKLTSLPMCGFIAQLVEQRTGNAEVTGSNPVEALIFFRLLLSNCLNWKIYCDDHSSPSSTTAVQNELFHYFTLIIILIRSSLSLHAGPDKFLNGQNLYGSAFRLHGTRRIVQVFVWTLVNSSAGSL